VNEAVQHQRAMARLCLDARRSNADLAALQDPRITIYRNLVRTRLRDTLWRSLPRTAVALGADAFECAIELYLARGPRSRFLREATLEFAEVLRDSASPWAGDVLELELARFVAGWLEDTRVRDLCAFDLEKVPVFHTTATRVVLGHQSAAGELLEPPRVGASVVLVHRRDDLLIEARTLDATAAALVHAWMTPDRTALEGVHKVLQAQGRAPDAGFVDQMSTLLAKLLESGALLGSVPR
jgi:hypothetical protein